MKLRGLSWGSKRGLVVQILGGRFDVVIGLLVYSLVVMDLRARPEAQLTPDCLSRVRFLKLVMVRVRRIGKLRCSLRSLAETNRKNLMMSLGEGTGWEC